MNYVATLMGVLEAVAVVIVSVLMLRGEFNRMIAYLGIGAGAIGVFSEALKPLLGVSYAYYGVLLMIWIIAIGWEFVRLARQRASTPAPAVQAELGGAAPGL